MPAPKIKSLSQGYVFYERLRDEENDELKQLYNTALHGVQQYTSFYQAPDLNNVSAQLLAMSSQELAKEQRALLSLFDVQLDLNLDDPAATKQLIDAFNKTLNLKSAYDRNIGRIKSALEKKQINVASFYDSYFLKIWKQKQDWVFSEIKKVFSPTEQGWIQVSETLERCLEEVVQLALKDMLSSAKETGQSRDSGSGYEELLRIFESYAGTNVLTQRLYSLYGMDDIKNFLMQEIKNSNTMIDAGQVTGKVSSIVTKNHFSKGGFTLEYLENYIASALTSGVVSNKGVQITVKGNATHSGASQMKADNILSFNIDLSIIEQAINRISGQKTSRENIVSEINKLTSHLADIHSGFIIYSSAKNYTMSKSFEGFSAGSPVSVATMRNITEDKTKMGAILQTVDGAVGKEAREDIKFSIAEDIAYYLFDDFDTLGKDSKTGATALHLFDLDGIYVPLSVLLHKIGRAVESVRKVPTSLINVSINTPSNIKYPTNQDMPQDAWQQQKEEAANNTKISIHFFKDFFNMIRSF